MHYNDIMEIERLRYANVSPAGDSFHAVRAVFRSTGQSEVREHCHDFLEWIVVLEGEARHYLNGRETMLRPGQLVLIRPDDRHGIQPMPGGMIDFVNVAFPMEVWDDFVRATGLQEAAGEWMSAPSAVYLELTPHQRQTMTMEAMAAVRSYHNKPTRLAFSQFWRAAAGALAEHGDSGDGSPEQPLWLRNTQAWAQSIDTEELSLDTLVEASGVSFGHLSRSLKTHTGLTPTEFINGIRVKRAAYELATTDRDVTAIAFDCGFENLSYFYRRFREIHGKTPRRYREEAKLSLPW